MKKPYAGIRSWVKGKKLINFNIVNKSDTKLSNVNHINRWIIISSPMYKGKHCSLPSFLMCLPWNLRIGLYEHRKLPSCCVHIWYLTQESKKNIICFIMKSHTCVIRRLKGEKRRILSRKYLFCFLVTKSDCVPLDTEVKDSSQTRNTLLRPN